MSNDPIEIENNHHSPIESSGELLQRDPEGLGSRIEFYQRYGQKPDEWYSWVSDQIQLSKTDRVLELGCGSGELWSEGNWDDYAPKQVILSDVTESMLDESRDNLSNRFPEFDYLRIDAQSLPFRSGEFDVVIANHVLHLVGDLDLALSEVYRVLREGGILFATTKSYQNFEGIDQNIRLAGLDASINDIDDFALENAKSVLDSCFASVEQRAFREIIQIEDIAPIVTFVESKLDMGQSVRKQFISQLQRELMRSTNLSNTYEPQCLTFEKRMGILRAEK